MYTLRNALVVQLTYLIQGQKSIMELIIGGSFATCKIPACNRGVTKNSVEVNGEHVIERISRCRKCEAKPYHCTYCLNTYNDMKGLRQHAINKHVPLHVREHCDLVIYCPHAGCDAPYPRGKMPILMKHIREEHVLLEPGEAEKLRTPVKMTQKDADKYIDSFMAEKGMKAELEKMARAGEERNAHPQEVPQEEVDDDEDSEDEKGPSDSDE